MDDAKCSILKVGAIVGPGPGRALSIAVTLVLAFAACGPPLKFIHTGPSYPQSLAGLKRIAIFGDLCVARDGPKDNDYWSIGDSTASSSAMLDATGRYLRERGYQIGSDLPSFVCATTLLSSHEENPYSQAAVSFMRGLEVDGKDRHPVSTGPPSSLQTLAPGGAVDAVLFVKVRGKHVTGKRQAAQAIVTALATLGGVMVYETSFIDSYAYLVHPSTGELLWANSLRIEADPANPSYFADLDAWADRIFRHFGLPGGQKGHGRKERGAADSRMTQLPG